MSSRGLSCSSSRSSSSKGCTKNSEGNATVTVFTCDLDDPAGAVLPSFLGSFGQHWGVYIQLDGNKWIYLCEANDDGHSIIEHTCKRMSKEDAFGARKSVKYRDLGKVYIEACDLPNICKNITADDPVYNIMTNNCQNWVQKLLDKLGCDLTAFLEDQGADMVWKTISWPFRLFN